jgi:hypothetical protein
MTDKYTLLTRRDFVRGAVGATLGGTVMGVGARELRAPAGRTVRASRVTLVRDPGVLNAGHDVDVAILERMLTDTLLQVTGEKTARAAWSSLVRPADVVGLVATQHLNPTHPELVQAVRGALVAAGVPAGNIRDVQGAIDKVRPCTALISLPALKAHWLAGLGTVLKNYIMFSGNPSRYHDANNVNLGEIWNLADVKGKTRLILVDALRPLCDKGPQPDPRYMWDYKGLIAGTDPVAVETIGLHIIMEKRQLLRGEPWPLSPPPLSVAAADERYGLGTSRMDEIVLNRVGWAQDVLV